MNALELVKAPRGDNIGPCVNGCVRDSKHRSEGPLRRDGTHHLYLAGHPAGVLCDTCVAEARKVWAEALVAT